MFKARGKKYRNRFSGQAAKDSTGADRKFLMMCVVCVCVTDSVRQWNSDQAVARKAETEVLRKSMIHRSGCGWAGWHFYRAIC